MNEKEIWDSINKGRKYLEREDLKLRKQKNKLEEEMKFGLITLGRISKLEFIKSKLKSLHYELNEEREELFKQLNSL